MSSKTKKIVAEFYKTSSGTEPVRKWLKGLPIEDCKIIGKDIATIEFTWPVGMPLCRPLNGGILEVRSDLEHGRISRVLFFNLRSRMVLVHGFIKKAQKTPPRDLQLAIKRMKEVLKHDS